MRDCSRPGQPRDVTVSSLETHLGTACGIRRETGSQCPRGTGGFLEPEECLVLGGTEWQGAKAARAGLPSHSACLLGAATCSQGGRGKGWNLD